MMDLLPQVRIPLQLLVKTVHDFVQVSLKKPLMTGSKMYVMSHIPSKKAMKNMRRKLRSTQSLETNFSGTSRTW